MCTDVESPEPVPFSLEFDLDEARDRLTIKLRGHIVSATYLEQCTAYYCQMSEPGRFDRLVDCTESSGYVSFDHLTVLSDLWRTLLSRVQRVVNVAIVSRDPLTHARMGIVDHLSDKQRHHAFYTVEDGDAWLTIRRNGA